jgi:hypothetical protein
MRKVREYPALDAVMRSRKNGSDHRKHQQFKRGNMVRKLHDCWMQHQTDTFKKQQQ